MSGVRLAAIALGCALVAGMTFCGRRTPAPLARPTAEVTTVTAVPRDIPVTFEIVAQTQSSQSVNIQACVSGFPDKRVCTEGSVVKAGRVLFLMDPKPLQAQVDAAQAALNNAQASLEVAKFNLDRTKPLAEQHALSQKDLDDANGQCLSSKANVDQARANFESAKLNLSYATITSPITGVSGSAIVADGTYVSASNSQLTTVSLLSPMWVTFSLSEADALRYRDEVDRGLLKRPPGDQYTVEIVMADGSLFPETGHIAFTDPAYNSQTGTFGGVSTELSNLLKEPNRVWSYGGGLLGPIFSGGAITGQVRQAEAAQQAALYGYEYTVQGAFADVENALIAQQKTRAKFEAQQGLVDARSEYTRLARLQYNGGYVPYSTVLQAEQQLFPAELTLAQDRAQVFGAAVGVYQSLGGGWVTLADDLTRVSASRGSVAAGDRSSP